MEPRLLDSTTLQMKSTALDRPLAAARAAKTPDGVRKAAVEFEAMFLTEMLQPMFEGLKTTGLFGEGQAGSIYRSLLLDQYGKSMAKAGGIGIADAVAREMIRMQEAQRP